MSRDKIGERSAGYLRDRMAEEVKKFYPELLMDYSIGNIFDVSPPFVIVNMITEEF